MLFSNVAFDVGIVFLAVACLLFVTVSGKSFGALGRAIPVNLVLAIAAIFGLYAWWPEITTRAGQLFSDSAEPDKKTPFTPTASLVAAPLPSAIKTAPRPAARPRITVIEEATPERIIVPSSSVPAADLGTTGPDPYDSKIKRGAKAVGRFLHLHKDRP